MPDMNSVKVDNISYDVQGKSIIAEDITNEKQYSIKFQIVNGQPQLVCDEIEEGVISE